MKWMSRFFQTGGRRGWLFWALAICIAALLSGCWASQDPQAAQPPKTVVTVWTKDRHDIAYQTARIEDYNRTNPDGILVEYRTFSDNYLQVLDSAFQSGSAPDLIAYTDQVFYQFYAQKHFADWTPYMDERFHETFDSVLLEGVNVFDGVCYFIPTCATTPRLFYNKSILERAGIPEPPVTMEEMIAGCRQITERLSGEGIYGFAANFHSAKSALDRALLEQGSRQLGIKAGYDFQRGCYDFTPYALLLEQWRELLSDRCAYPRCMELDIDPLRQIFADGKIGMYISYIHSEAGVYQRQFPMAEEWGCAPLPTSGGQVKGAQNYSLNNGYLLNQGCEHPEAAWTVYRELFADVDTLTEYYESGYGVSMLPQVLARGEKDGYTPAQPALLIGEGDQLWPLAPHEENPEAVMLEGQDFNLVFKELIFGTEPVKPVLDELTRRYNEAYQAGLASGIGREIRYPDFDPLQPQLALGETG